MKLKQRFAILGTLILILFTTRSHWIPHLRRGGLFQNLAVSSYFSSEPQFDDPHAAKHHELKSSIRHHAGHFRGDRIQIGSDADKQKQQQESKSEQDDSSEDGGGGLSLIHI